MSKPSAPTPPDPVASINAQSGANKENLTQNSELNRINQYGPTGSLTYNIAGYNQDGTPQYEQHTQLSPELQNLYGLSLQGGTGLLNTAIGMQGQVKNSYANPIDTSNAPGLASRVNANPVDFNAPQGGNIQNGLNLSGQPPLQSQAQNPGIPFALSAGQTGPIQSGVNSPGIPLALGANGGPIQSHIAQPGVGIASQVNGGQTWQDAVQQAQNAAYRGQSQYLDPQFSQGQEALDSKLANQGIVQGSEAYNNAQGNFARQKQAAYQSAQDAAVQAGNQEQNVLFGQGMSAAELQNAARGQVFGENSAQQQAFNQAQAQRFGQGAVNAGILNSAQGQAYNQNLQSGQFANNAQAQQFGQGATNAGILNNAQNQAFGQNLSQAELGNSANQQAFGQAATQGQFANSAEAQNFAQQQAQQQAINAAQQQQYGQSLQSGQFQNNAQQQYLQQLFALRNQPLNEYSALMSGGQVQSPNLPFNTGYAQANVAPVNAAGIYQNNFQNQQANYQTQMAGINNLFGLGGTLGAAKLLAG